jgi:peptide deformylase
MGREFEMAIRNVVLYPDDPLTLKAAPFESTTPDLPQLAADMLDTMYAYEGVGLAGPQIGLQQRIFVMHDPEGEPQCLVNPQIVASDGEVLGEEGCLSLPQLYAEVPRAAWIRVKSLNEHGEELDFETEGFSARIIQHELDHLDGVIFLDRLDILTRQAKLAEWDEIRARLIAGAESP